MPGLPSVEFIDCQVEVVEMTDYVDRSYQATRLSPAEERKRQCHRKGCDAAIDTTEPCALCGDRYCPEHLTDELCNSCFYVSDAADLMNDAEAFAVARTGHDTWEERRGER